MGGSWKFPNLLPRPGKTIEEPSSVLKKIFPRSWHQCMGEILKISGYYDLHYVDWKKNLEEFTGQPEEEIFEKLKKNYKRHNRE